MSWLTIAGMMAVTWVPRFVPLMLSRDLPMPRWIRRWLSSFPYAALGALIFPGILGAIPDAPLVAVGAGVVALAVALKAKSPVIPVLAAIAAAALLDLVM
jgi:branched-subunit amino acid transport protein